MRVTVHSVALIARINRVIRLEVALIVPLPQLVARVVRGIVRSVRITGLRARMSVLPVLIVRAGTGSVHSAVGIVPIVVIGRAVMTTVHSVVVIARIDQVVHSVMTSARSEAVVNVPTALIALGGKGIDPPRMIDHSDPIGPSAILAVKNLLGVRAVIDRIIAAPTDVPTDGAAATESHHGTCEQTISRVTVVSIVN
ncbi:hypothetical protein GCM10022198_19740 [Klugiella xanthotipulae]